jgi:pimeloyl-ACP methyl ester carboxylesterase
MGGAAADSFVLSGAPALHGEAAGEGLPVVLCHGITATRRYVLHGSRALERAGHRVITYDARGHGESDPTPAGEGYGYPEMVGDLERLVEQQVGEGRFLLGGHSMGSHTACAYALRHPERLAGLIVIGPVFVGRISERALAYWDGLADALEQGGVEGFVAYIGAEQGIEAAWRESVLGFTRTRMEAHRYPEAVAAALRQVPRSRPFDSLEELRKLQMPALVVASRDEADPGHPYRTAESYARELPQSELISEAAGESPLAWQGGRLSREIAAFSKPLSSSL